MPIAQLHIQPDLIAQVHDRLLTAVVDGTLPPGQRLTQDELAEMLGVSRQPVSHAIQMLRRRGLFVDAGKRGVAVAPIDAQRIRDLYQVRAALDGLATELAAARFRARSVSGAELSALKAALEAGTVEVRTVEHMNFTLLVDADVAFHSSLHRLSGNDALLETVVEQWPHFRRSMRHVLGSPDIARRVWSEHAEIFAAVTGGRVSDAGRLARQHAERASQDTVHRLEAAGLSEAISS